MVGRLSMDLAFLDAKPKQGRLDMIVEEEKNVVAWTSSSDCEFYI
jgi:hypothetical protein